MQTTLAVMGYNGGGLRGCVMPTYKFQVGQTVFVTPSLVLNIPGGAYTVTKKLPERNGEREYRVKSANEPYERVVRESELSDLA